MLRSSREPGLLVALGELYIEECDEGLGGDIMLRTYNRNITTPYLDIVIPPDLEMEWTRESNVFLLASLDVKFFEKAVPAMRGCSIGR